MLDSSTTDRRHPSETRPQLSGGRGPHRATPSTEGGNDFSDESLAPMSTPLMLCTSRLRTPTTVLRSAQCPDCAIAPPRRSRSVRSNRRPALTPRGSLTGRPGPRVPALQHASCTCALDCLLAPRAGARTRGGVPGWNRTNDATHRKSAEGMGGRVPTNDPCTAPDRQSDVWQQLRVREALERD